MKKLILLMVFVTALSAESIAQPGIQAGWNISGYRLERSGTKYERGWNSGFNAGVMYRTPGRYVSLQPTVLYSQKGAVNQNTGSVYVTGVSDYTNNLSYVQLSLPVILKIGLGIDDDWSFDVGVGPYAGFLAAASVKTKYLNGDTDKKDYKIGNSSSDDFKRTDAGLSLYLGARLGHFNTSIGYDLGLIDGSPNGGESLRNRCFSLNLGAFF